MQNHAFAREQLVIHNEFVIAEALSPFNKWVTGEEVHHDPTPFECVEHFIQNGGLDEVTRLEDELTWEI
ncbi:MAG: hypothetical protein G01um101472_333 [Parcubacteria group bacterium Gr01-1014_72]|nr:MAG: hypothetical protein G01um101472_333 [Parcubacteria group bacterium Gr01-1014_72]